MNCVFVLISECVNPVIVYPTTKKLHAINPLKHFPHMSQQFVSILLSPDEVGGI